MVNAAWSLTILGGVRGGYYCGQCCLVPDNTGRSEVRLLAATNNEGIIDRTRIITSEFVVN